jgi:uncharacterized protein YciI
VHIVDLPGADAARVFALDEPNYISGVYSEVQVRRFRNMLGRTMWDFTGAVAGYRRFLIIGHGKPGMTAARDVLRGEHRRYLATGGYCDRLIACGPLLSGDGSEWMGTAAMAELPDRGSAEAMLPARPIRAGRFVRQHRGPRLAVRRPTHGITSSGAYHAESGVDKPSDDAGQHAAAMTPSHVPSRRGYEDLDGVGTVGRFGQIPHAARAATAQD